MVSHPENGSDSPIGLDRDRGRDKGSGFSLGFRPIESSVLDEARSKVALHGDGYVWAPIWWSSENSKR